MAGEPPGADEHGEGDDQLQGQRSRGGHPDLGHHAGEREQFLRIVHEINNPIEWYEKVMIWLLLYS